MTGRRLKAVLTLCAGLLGLRAYAQSLPQVKVEFQGSLRSYYRTTRPVLAREAAEGFAGVLARRAQKGLKAWSFGIDPSSYVLLLTIAEESTRDHFVLSVDLQTWRNLSLFDTTPVGRADWCKAGDEENIPACNHVVIYANKQGGSATKIVTRLVDIFDKGSKEILGWEKLMQELTRRVPIAENVQWYDKRLHKSTTRLQFPGFSVVTPILHENRNQVQSPPFIWCENQKEKMELALKGEWMDGTFGPLDSVAGPTKTLGLTVVWWQDQPGVWKKLKQKERMCREGYDLREVRFKPYWLTEDEL